MTRRPPPAASRPAVLPQVCRILAAVAVTAAAVVAAAAGGCARDGGAGRSPTGGPTRPAATATTTTAGDRFTVAGGTVELKLTGSRADLPPAVVLAWVRKAAEACVAVCGHFPVDHVTVEVRLGGGGTIEHGVTYDGRLIRVRLGRRTRPDDLADDWVMTHEMFHLAFPDTDNDLNWMGEGLSTYIEPIARCRVGVLNEAEVWGGYVLGMPQGLPEAGDRGLNRTHTWGRTYWGGALFWLSADVEIRRQTDNRRSLDDALKAILAAGGNGTEHWAPERIINVGDRATGTTVLATLYARHAEQGTPTDLPALWKSLGIKSNPDNTVDISDDAPLATVRRAMTARAG